MPSQDFRCLSVVSNLRLLNPFEESALRVVRIASPNRKPGRDDCALRGALNIAHGSGKAAAPVCAEGVNGFSGKVGASRYGKKS